MCLIKRGTYVEFIKTGNPLNNHIYESVSFSLTSAIILDFIKLVDLDGERVKQNNIVNDELITFSYGERLHTFLGSLKPYFDDREVVKKGLFKLKILELLYDLSESNPIFLQQLMILDTERTVDLVAIVEKHYLEPYSLSELARISQRSLSRFRRDFEAIFHTTPAKWIQERRLHKAKDLLQSTDLSVARVCFEVGYENISHFSRLYKSFFGHSPSESKSQKK